MCVLTLHQFSQEGDGLRQQQHVVLLQLGRQLHQHQQGGETHLRTIDINTQEIRNRLQDGESSARVSRVLHRAVGHSGTA